MYLTEKPEQTYWPTQCLLSLDIFCCCCCLVAKLYLTLCNPMDCSMLGFPVLHCLLEFTQTHVHQVNDVIQPSHPLLPPSPTAFPSIRVFSSESVLCIRWPEYWSFSFSISPFSEYSGVISFRIGLIGWICLQGNPRDF